MAAGLIGAPAAWAAQMLLGEILTGNGCSPYALHTPALLRGHLHFWLVAVSMACCAAALLSGGAAGAAWRRMHGGEEHVIEAGEGRARFLAMLGAMNSALFIVAIIFTACALLLVAPCKM